MQIKKVESCLADVKRWMSLNFLQLNTRKIEMKTPEKIGDSLTVAGWPSHPEMGMGFFPF